MRVPAVVALVLAAACARAAETVPAAPAPFELPPLASFSATVDRPLFVRGRKPAPGARTARVMAGAPRLALAGVALSGGRRLALLQPDGAKEPVPAAEGAEVAGWTVERVLSDRVELRRGSETVWQPLREFRRAP
ncbi:MAG: hypothetical protein ACM31L_17920 [Actinomycetota bacterium]